MPRPDTLTDRRLALIEALRTTPQGRFGLRDFGSIPEEHAHDPSVKHKHCIEGVMCSVFHARTGKGHWINSVWDSASHTRGFCMDLDKPEELYGDNCAAPAEVFDYFGMSRREAGDEAMPFDCLMGANDSGVSFASFRAYLGRKWHGVDFGGLERPRKCVRAL